MYSLRKKIFDWGTAVLTRPRADRPVRPVASPEVLRRTLRPGDVLLIEGDQRVSEVIKFLTQSSWSHAALYLGPPSGFSRQVSAEADTAEILDQEEVFLLEAVLGGGVTLSPLSRYERYNVRICRPTGLRAEDLARVVSKTVSQLGSGYDVRHIFELARYFFPVSLIPARFRQKVLGRTSTLTKDVICSTLIAEAFQEVGFPILPHLVAEASALHTRRPARLRFWERPYTGQFEHKHARLITPRDFDLSPYFAVVKLPVEGSEGFDYRRMRWVGDEASTRPPSSDEA